jgi:hypothetical protein
VNRLVVYCQYALSANPAYTNIAQCELDVAPINRAFSLFVVGSAPNMTDDGLLIIGVTTACAKMGQNDRGQISLLAYAWGK